MTFRNRSFSYKILNVKYKEAFTVNRYEELDSLRGIAALSVLFGHIYLVFQETFFSNLIFEYGILRVLIAGSEAVTLFFVLSGFVLSLPFYSDRKFKYGEYAVKRFCRIYIPYIFTIGLAILLKEVFYSGKISNLTEWFNTYWSQSLDINSLKDHLILVGTFTSNLNSVVWSLVHEMRISFIFPFFMVLIINLNLKKGIFLAFSLSCLGVLISLMSNKPFSGTEVYYTVHCISLFILGALLAKYRLFIIEKASKITNRYKIILFIIGIILYLYAHPAFILSFFIDKLNPFYKVVIDSWFTSFGAILLIILAITPSFFSKILQNKIINYVGEISYSLYLTHLLVLFSCIHFLYNKLPMWQICVIVVLLTFCISSIMYYLIEKPSIIIGKKITCFIYKGIEKNKSINQSIKSS